MVFRTTEPMKSLRTARIGISIRRTIKLAFQPPSEVVVLLLVRPWPRPRRHSTSAKLTNHLFPRFRMRSNVFYTKRVEGKSTRT